MSPLVGCGIVPTPVALGLFWISLRLSQFKYWLPVDCCYVYELDSFTSNFFLVRFNRKLYESCAFGHAVKT